MRHHVYRNERHPRHESQSLLRPDTQPTQQPTVSNVSSSSSLVPFLGLFVLVALILAIWALTRTYTVIQGGDSGGCLSEVNPCVTGTPLTIGSLASVSNIDSNVTLSHDLKVEGQCFCNSLDVDPAILMLGTELATAVYIGPSTGNVSILSPFLFAQTIEGRNGTLTLEGVIVINGTLVTNTTTIGQTISVLLTNVIDTIEPGGVLQVGPNRASLIQLASPSTMTETMGTSRFDANIDFGGEGNLDTVLGDNNILIGTITAQGIRLTRPGRNCTIGGKLVVNQELAVADAIDTFAGNRLIIGPEVALSIDMGASTIPIRLLGSLLVHHMDALDSDGLTVGINTHTIQVGNIQSNISMNGFVTTDDMTVVSSLKVSRIVPHDDLSNVTIGAPGSIVVVPTEMIIQGTLFFGQLGDQSISVAGVGTVSTFNLGSNSTVVNIPGSSNVTGDAVCWSVMRTSSLDTITDDDTLQIGPTAHEIRMGHTGSSVVLEDQLEVNGPCFVQGQMDTLDNVPLLLGSEQASQIVVGRSDAPTFVQGDLTVVGDTFFNNSVFAMSDMDVQTPGGTLFIAPDRAARLVLGSETCPVAVLSSLNVVVNISATAVLTTLVDFVGTLRLGPEQASTIIIGSTNSTTIIHGNLVTDAVIGGIGLLSPIVDTPTPGIPLQIAPVNASVVFIARPGINTQVFGPLMANDGISTTTLNAFSDGLLLIGTNATMETRIGQDGRTTTIASLLTVLEEATFAEGVFASTLDTDDASSLVIGGTNADQIVLGDSDTDTLVQSTLRVASTLVFGHNATLDTASASFVLRIAPQFAPLVTLGHSTDTSVIEMVGVLQCDSDVFIEDSLDTRVGSSSSVLQLGPVHAVRVDVAKSGTPTRIRGDLTIEQLIDTSTATQLVVGDVATGIVMVPPVTIQNTLHTTGMIDAPQVVTPVVDSLTTLSLATTDASSVVVARSGVTTHIDGPLDVESSIDSTSTLRMCGSNCLATDLSRPTILTTARGPFSVQDTLTFDQRAVDAPNATLLLGTQTTRATVVGSAASSLTLASTNITIAQTIDSIESNWIGLGPNTSVGVSIGSFGNPIPLLMYGPLFTNFIDTDDNATIDMGLSSDLIIVGGVGGTVRIRGGLYVDEIIDSTVVNDTLEIGKFQTSHVQLGNIDIPTDIFGPLIVSHSIRMTGNATIDTGTNEFHPEAGEVDALYLGPVEANAIVIGRVNASTTIRDILLVDSGWIDCNQSNDFYLAPSVPHHINIGSPLSTTLVANLTVNGTLVVNRFQVTGDVVAPGALTVSADPLTLQTPTVYVTGGGLDTTGASLTIGAVHAPSVMVTPPLFVSGVLHSSAGIVMGANTTLDGPYLFVGTVTAVGMDMGRVGTTTRIMGTLQTDTLSAMTGPLRVVSPTVFMGTLQVVSTLTVGGVIDSASTLQVGPTTSVDLASASTPTRVLDTLEVVDVATFDAGVISANVDSPAAALTLGATATTVVMGGVSTILNAQGALQLHSSLIFQGVAGVVDTSTALPITVGTHASVVTIVPILTVSGESFFTNNISVGTCVFTATMDCVSMGCNLAIGTARATTIDIGNVASNTHIHGNLITDTVIAAPTVNASAIDSPPGTPLQLGPVTASSIILANVGTPTLMRGPLQVNGDVMVASVVDTQTNTALVLGPALATQIRLATAVRALSTVQADSNMTVAGVLFAATMDFVGPMTLGVLSSTQVTVARPGVVTIVQGPLTVASDITMVHNGSLDCTEGRVGVGTALADEVHLARVGITTYVDGPLSVASTIDAAGTLALGTRSPALVLGQLGAVTVIQSNLTVASLSATNVDSTTPLLNIGHAGAMVFMYSSLQVQSDVDAFGPSGQLRLGPTTASVITLSRPGGATQVKSALQLEASTWMINNSTLDTLSFYDSLRIGTVNASEVDVGRPATFVRVGGSASVAEKLLVPVVDSSTTLSLCGTTCTSLSLARSGVVSTFQGPLKTVTIDGNSATLAMGTTTDSTAVTIGRSAITTTLQGPLALASTLDMSTATALLMGTVTATSIQIGSTTIPVSIPGITTFTTLLTATLDTTSSVQALDVGTNTTLLIQIGRMGGTTTFYSTLVRIQGSLDTQGAAMTLGTTNAASVSLGVTGRTTSVLSSLLVAGNVDVISAVSLDFGLLTATAVNVGRAGIITSLISSIVQIGGTLDTITSQVLNVGTTNAAGVTVGQSGITLTLRPNSVLIGATLDTIAANNMNIGTGIALQVTIGRTGQTLVLPSSTLTIGGTIDSTGGISIGPTAATSLTLGHAAIATTVASTQLNVGGTIDSANAITLGGTNALSLTLGHTAITTTVASTQLNVGGTIDSANAITLGGTNALSITVGHTAITTTVASTQLNVGGTIDSANAMTIGGTNALSLTLAKAAITTTIRSNNLVIGSTIDSASAIIIGGATTTSLTLGRTAITTTLSSTQVNVGGNIDTTGVLALGTSTATAVTVGSAGVTTTITSTQLNVGGNIDSSASLHMGTVNSPSQVIGRTGTTCTMNSDFVLSGTINTVTVPAAAWTALSLFSVSTWTPTMTDSAANAFTTTTRKGTYQRLGTYYQVTIHIVWTGKGTAVSTNTVQIGLPVAAGTSNDNWVFTLGKTTGINSALNLAVNAAASASFLTIQLLSSTGTAPTTCLVSSLTTAGDIMISGFYSSL